MQHYKNYWRGFSDFDGQSSRKDFWIPILINLAISIALLIVVVTSFAAWLIPFAPGIWFTGVSLAALFVWCIIRIVPNAAVLVRRFHDVGLVGWLAVVLFICHFIPYVDIVADILIVIIACMNSNSADVEAFAWKKPATDQNDRKDDSQSTSSTSNSTKDNTQAQTEAKDNAQVEYDELKQNHYEQLSLSLDDKQENDSKSDDSQN